MPISMEDVIKIIIFISALQTAALTQVQIAFSESSPSVIRFGQIADNSENLDLI